MYLALSIASTKGLWVLLDTSLELLGFREWEDDQNKDLWKDMESQLEHLLVEHKISLDSINTLFCVSGPGAYTGLRISSAYCKGLSLSLGIALISIPSFDLNNQKPFFIPIRQQLLKNLNLEQALKKSYEFLKITGVDSATLCTPVSNDTIWGMIDNPTWPTASQIQKGVKLNINKNSTFELFYGLGPKVSGKYLKEENT